MQLKTFDINLYIWDNSAISEIILTAETLNTLGMRKDNRFPVIAFGGDNVCHCVELMSVYLTQRHNIISSFEIVRVRNYCK